MQASAAAAPAALPHAGSRGPVPMQTPAPNMSPDKPLS